MTYESAMPGSAGPDAPKTFLVPGKALRDAPPAAGERFPLVIVSHGYPGSRTFLTYLTENLASKGYVVAAIDHTDSVFGRQAAFPVRCSIAPPTSGSPSTRWRPAPYRRRIF